MDFYSRTRSKLPLGGLLQINLWEVDFGLNGIIKIVCERVEPDIRDDLCDFAVAAASRSQCFNLRLVNLPAARHEITGKTQRCIDLRITRIELPAGQNVFFLLSHHFPNFRVGGEAIFTAICLSHHDGNKFAQFAAKQAVAQRLVEVEVSLQCGGGTGENAHEIRNHFHLGLNCIKQSLRFTWEL